MKVLAAAAAAVLVLVAACAAPGRRGNRMVEVPIDAFAVVRVPARLQPRSPTTQWWGTTLHLTRSMNSFSAMGSHSPQHENLAVSQLEPRQAARLGEDILRYASAAWEHVTDIQWEESQRHGAIVTQHGSGRYTPNMLDRPAWLVRAWDTERNVVVSYRVLQDQFSRERAREVVDTALASFRLTGTVAGHFAAVERNLGSGVAIALPVELEDPFSWEWDDSGARWMYFRRVRAWSDDQEFPEQTAAVAVFFRPGDGGQAEVARGIAAAQLLADVTERQPGADDAEVRVERAVHRTGSVAEPAWLVEAVDEQRGVAFSCRIWQRDASREQAVDLVRRAVASYRFSGDPQSFARRGTD